MSWPLALAVYLAGFVAIQIGARIALRGEPTAHGQIVGRTLGFWIGLFWPVTLPWCLMALLYGVLGWVFARCRP